VTTSLVSEAQGLLVEQIYATQNRCHLTSVALDGHRFSHDTTWSDVMVQLGPLGLKIYDAGSWDDGPGRIFFGGSETLWWWIDCTNSSWAHGTMGLAGSFLVEAKDCGADWMHQIVALMGRWA
jgi:hypothetical protein